MSSFGQVPLKDVWAMLEQCAPDHSIQERTHHYCISYGEKSYPAFPKGEHEKQNPPIQKGHVRKMARFFGILECAKAALSI